MDSGPIQNVNADARCEHGFSRGDQRLNSLDNCVSLTFTNMLTNTFTKKWILKTTENHSLICSLYVANTLSACVLTSESKPLRI